MVNLSLLLSSAQLSSAQRSSAQLSSAQRSSTLLSSAQLRSARLSSAQLSSAQCFRRAPRSAQQVFFTAQLRYFSKFETLTLFFSYRHDWKQPARFPGHDFYLCFGRHRHLHLHAGQQARFLQKSSERRSRRRGSSSQLKIGSRVKQKLFIDISCTAFLLFFLMHFLSVFSYFPEN